MHAYIVFIFLQCTLLHLSIFYIQGPLCGNRCAVTVILLSRTLLLFLKFSCNLKTILFFSVGLYKSDLLRVSPMTYIEFCQPLTAIYEIIFLCMFCLKKLPTRVLLFYRLCLYISGMCANYFKRVALTLFFFISEYVTPKRVSCVF